MHSQRNNPLFLYIEKKRKLEETTATLSKHFIDIKGFFFSLIKIFHLLIPFTIHFILLLLLCHWFHFLLSYSSLERDREKENERKKKKIYYWPMK